MKHSTRIKKLAEKTNYPELEKIILEERGVVALPDRCLEWQGSVSNGNPREFTRRGYDGLPYKDIITEAPKSVIRVQGKEVPVHRFIFQLLEKPDYEYRMRRVCMNPKCVNPLHFEVIKLNQIQEEMLDADFEPPPETDEWTEADVEEMLETIFAMGTPATFEDLMNEEAFTTFGPPPPEGLVWEMLKKIRKDHMYATP